MLARGVGHGLVVLSSALVLSACYHAPARATIAQRASSAPVTTRTAGGQVAQSLVRPAILTLTTRAGSRTVDALSDSAAVSAIGSVITPLVPELTVENSARGAMLRLGQSRSANRLFLIDDVPVSDGFRVSIRTSVLESIEIVDDTILTAQYGPRAAAGVVLIATARKRQ